MKQFVHVPLFLLYIARAITCHTNIIAMLKRRRMNMTNENIEALAITDASYAITKYDVAASKEALKEAVQDLERLYASEMKALKFHQEMEPAAYSGVYVFNNMQAAVYRNTRAEAYKKAMRRIKDVLQNMD